MTRQRRFSRLLLTYLLLASTTSGCGAARRFVTTDLTGPQTWSGTIHVVGDVILEKGSRLVILPGTEVLFHPPGDRDRFQDHPNFPGGELIVLGTLVAEGTPQAPIIFRYADPDAPAGSWGGINLSDSVDSSFAFVNIRQADSAIHSQESRLYIEHSIFENNRVAIRFHSSQILIENNLIRDNGTGIRFHFGQPVICGNVIRRNGKGFFITSHPSDYLIENNSIVDNDRSVVLGEEVPEDVVMKRNYWGSTDSGVIRSRFFDGQVESYLGKVLIDPVRTEPDPDSGVHWNR